MVDVIIDDNAFSTLHNLVQPRSLVWTDENTGYIFFMDNGRDFHYRKTIDAGKTWVTEVNLKTGTIQKIGIWYDKWTKGDTGGIIHICYFDFDADDIVYNSLDTSDDSLGGEVVAFTGASASGGNWDSGCLSIIKARGGNVYVGGWIDSNGEHGFFKATDSPATSFASRTSMADGSQADRIQFLAGSEADSNDIWCIYQDQNTNEITLKVYDDSGNSWSESSVIDNIIENDSLFGFDSMDRHSDNHAFLVMWNQNQSTTGDLVTHDITNITTFSQKTDVVTNDNAYGTVGLMINQQNDDLFVSYNSATTVGSIIYQKSGDFGSNWDGATQMSETSDDHTFSMGGTSVGDDGGRWMPCWFNDDINDILTNSGNSINIAALGAAGVGAPFNYSDGFVSVTNILG